MLFIYFHPNLFNVKKHLTLVLKKIVHVVVYIFQTSLNKAVSISCKLPEWIRNIQMKQCFSTIKTWLRILHRFLHESCMIINKKYHNWSFSIFFVSVPLNYFCCRNFRVYEQIFQEYFLDGPVFKLVGIQKSINKILKKQLERNPFLR